MKPPVCGRRWWPPCTRRIAPRGLGNRLVQTSVQKTQLKSWTRTLGCHFSQTCAGEMYVFCHHFFIRCDMVIKNELYLTKVVPGSGMISFLIWWVFKIKIDSGITLLYLTATFIHYVCYSYEIGICIPKKSNRK